MPNLQNIVLPDKWALFFYKTIMGNLNDPNFSYKSSKAKAFNRDRGLTIKATTAKGIPAQVGDNCIYYVKSRRNNLFIRFRNAFAHLQIVIDGNYLELIDLYHGAVTMRGRIKGKDLKDLCALFLPQPQPQQQN